MSSQRHVIRRYDSARVPDFDEQFWPVAMATCVLAAFTVGSILTVLSGPWMWGSLLAIPILVGLVLLALSHVEQRFWRRSIQIALLLSLAFHLAVLIIAYRTEIFSGRHPAQVALDRPLSPIPQLDISVVQREAIWNQPNPIETPQPEVAVERQVTAEPSQAQPVELPTTETSENNPNPKLERKESTAEVTPKSGESLSKRSRNNDATNPQSRELNVASNALMRPTARRETSEDMEAESVQLRRNTDNADPKPVARRQTDPDSSEVAQVRDPRRREETPAEQSVAAARHPRRTAQIEPESTAAPAQPPRPTRAEPAEEHLERDLPAADVAATRRDVSPTLTRSADDSAASPQADRQPQRSEQTQVADTLATAQASERIQRPRRSRAPAESTDVAAESPSAPQVERVVQPAPQATSIARQQIADEQWISQSQPAERSELTPTNQQARLVRRRSTTVDRPSDLAASGAVPRLARDPAATPTTSESLEAPSVAAAGGQPSASNEAKSFALERSTSGVSGLGATPNFGRASESMASPAQTASDSARREQAESPSNSAETLSPSQAAKISRSRAGLDTPQVALPNPTTSDSERSAGAEPQPVSASSAAAVTSARAAGRRSEFSADAGSADLDLGSTKVVSGTARRESAGGGQPELSPAQPAASRAAAREGAAQASIVADTSAESVTAPLSEGSAQPSNLRASPDAAAMVVQKRGGSNPQTQGPSRGTLTGDPAESSSAATRDRQITSRESRRSNRGNEGSDSLQDEPSTDTARSRVARQSAHDGPETQGQPEGIASRSTAAQSDDESEAAGSEISRADRAESMAAVSPSLAQSDDGLAGSSQIASNSMQRRGEQTPATDGESQTLASSPDRATQGLSLEVASGTEGSEFSRGMANQADPNTDESSPRSLEPARATGNSVASIGPNTRRGETASTTSARLGAGSGRAEAGSANDGPAESLASKPRRSEGAALDAGETAMLIGPASEGLGAAATPNRSNDRVSSARRNETTQAHVDIDADEGSGGLGQMVQPDIGVASRRASPTSDVVAPEPTSRFRSREASGELAVSPSANVAKASFGGRNPGNLARSGPQTERAIELGLAFLIRNQRADGHWSLLGFDEGHASKQMQLDSDTAATGLALLAFQGAGYTHREFKYADRLQRAVAWLVAHQAADGNLYVPSDKLSNASCQLYSHAIATLALAEAYGMTQDPNIRESAQKALDFIVSTQDPKHGGWRYQSAIPERSTDTSVTGWMVMALHSGRLAGLDVDPHVWVGIDDWLQTAQAGESESQFVYSPFVQDDPNRRIVRSHLRRASNCMTAIGLLMRIYTSSDRSDPRLAEAAAVLLKQMPSEFSLEVRDTYYWYYATQVLRHVGGPSWQAWNNVLHPLLLSTQVPDGDLAGSWHPYAPVEDKFGRFGGRLYVTALNLLSLEVDYRLLPLYENTVAPRE